MSWLNLNQSLSSLKGQITNFATEVLSEGVIPDNEAESSENEPSVKELEEKCSNQELEIAALKKLNDELQATLQSERLSRKNGLKEEESSWYWDPPSQPSRSDHEIEKQYKLQIQALQSELSALKDRDTLDHAVDNEEVMKLRQENQNLTSSLEDLDNQHQVAMERLLTLKKELQKNFEVLKQEHQELKNNNDEYAEQIKVLLQKISDRDQEIESLKLSHPDYDTVFHKYQNLERIHSLLRENAEKFQEENQELHEEVFKLQEQVTKLEHDAEVDNKHSELSHMVPIDKYEKVLKELNDLKHRRTSNSVHLDEVNIDDNAKSVIETLKRDIDDLKLKLSQRDREYNETMENKIIKPDKIMQLYNRYVNFDLPVDYVGEIPTGTENVIMQKLEGVFKTLNTFKKDIDALEHKLSEKKQCINNFQTQIEDVTTENEYLTSDIQHLESELEEMKKNNDFLLSEIAALKNTSKLEPIIETHEDNLAKLETELADCNRINKTFESEIKRIENELSDVQHEKKILQESLNDMKNKYTSMLNELKMCKAQTQAVQELESNANVTHSVKLQEAVDKIDNLQKRLHSANSKNEQLSIDIHILENDKVLLAKQIEDLKLENESMRDAHKELESANKTLNSNVNDLKNKLDESINHKNDLDSKLRQLENEIVANKKSRQVDIENVPRNENIKMEELVTSSETNIEKVSPVRMADNIQEKILEENTFLKKKVESLTNDILNLQNQQHKLIDESNLLQDKIVSEVSNKSELQKIINELKLKADQFDTTNNSLLILKDENKKLLDKKLQLELELSSTDDKIRQLEDEFEKLIADLNEKDSIIDNLNMTVNKNKIDLQNLNQNVTDLENSVHIKSQEVRSLVTAVEELTQKLNSVTTNSKQSLEELSRLQVEKEEMNKQIYILNDEINNKNSEISKISSVIHELEKTCTESKLLLDSKDKEIKELKQSIVELTDKIKASENTTQPNDEYAKLLEDKQAIEKLSTELEDVLNRKEKELIETQNKLVISENTCQELKTMIDTATTEKNEIINLVNLKHNESIQYHNEIQRLNQVLLEQNNEFKKIMEEKDLLLKNNTNCTNCEALQLSLKEKDEIVMVLNKNVAEQERLKTELVNASEAFKNLTKRCEDLETRLAMQLETVKKLTAENVQLSEQEQNSSRELERLRHHLVELEENYTQELMASEQKLGECQTRLHQVEERAKQTSTVYTSNSIRANQEVETLRNQIKLLERQREEVQAKLSEADDARIRSEAALTNLQVVLEQFQLDKERDIHSATEKIRNQMEGVKRQNDALQREISRLNGKLDESIAGLKAATRLGDQVETKTAQINDLKEQVRALQAAITAAEERYYSAVSNQQDKVDKNLVKNLVVNYVLTANRSDLNRTQILRILSTVLDFNQTECEKLGLVRSANAGDSLAAEFVKFLHNESRPRAPLPDLMGLQGGRATPAPSSRKSSTIGPHPVFDVGHRRNPSTGSNNLLFQNMDSIETSSQVSIESDTRAIPINALDTGVNQTRNNEGAILKHVLKDM